MMEYDIMDITFLETDDLDEIEAWYDERATVLCGCMNTVRRVLQDTSNNRPSEYIEAVRLAYWLLNIASEGDDVPEYRSDVKLNGIALGQVIMEHVDPDDRYKLSANKRLWFDVADHMGPDYAQGMYHAATFVTKIA